LLLTIIKIAGVKHTDQGGSFDAVFPKQDLLGPDEIGNLISLPFNGQAAKRRASLLLDQGTGLHPHRQDLAENIEYFLENMTAIDEAEVDRLLKALGVDQDTASHRTTDPVGNIIRMNGFAS